MERVETFAYLEGTDRIKQTITSGSLVRHWFDYRIRCVDEAEGTTFANLKMISQLLLPWSTAPDTDISAYKGALPEPEPVKLPQDQAS